MAVVGSLYSSAAHKRTPEDVVKSLFQNTSESPDNTPRIKPMNKRVRATEKGQEINATEEILCG